MLGAVWRHYLLHPVAHIINLLRLLLLYGRLFANRTVRCLQNVVVVINFLLRRAYAAVPGYRPVNQTFTHHKVSAARKADLVVELGVAQLRQGDQGVIRVRIYHVFGADLVCHSGLIVDEDTEIEAVSYGLHVESLMARLLVTAAPCKELVQ